MCNKKWSREGFSLAEAMITLLIVSLILAAVVPVVSKRQSTPDKIWNYTQSGVGSDQADVYWGLRDGQTALIGGFSVPTNANGSRLALITAPDDNAITTENLKYSIRRSLISFFQRTGTGNSMIGKVSFDQWANTALGANTLNNAIPTMINSTAVTTANEDNIDGGANDSGTLNTAVGFNGLFSNTTGRRNVAVGNDSLAANTSGRGNTAVGSYAGARITTGSGNTAIGVASLQSETTATDNTAIGAQTLKHNTAAAYNTAIGSHAMWLNEGGTSNIAIGVNAMRIANYQDATFTNSQNVAVGNSALFNNRGIYNTAVGDASTNANTTGVWNTAIGHASLMSNTTGGSNTAIGLRSCDQVITGSYNVCLGSWSGPTAANSGLSNRLYIDIATRNDPLIGGDFANRTVTINGTLYTPTGGVSASDRRLKKDIKEENTGLEEILKLQIKSYKFTDDKKQRPHVGVIAQELQEIMPDAVVAGPGNDKLKEILFVDQNYILFKLVNAVKQLYAKTMSNLNRIVILEKEVKDLKSQNKHLKKDLTSMEERLSKLEKAKSK